MGFEIGDDIKKATKYCGKGFSCLDGGRNDLCRIRKCIGGKVHFIECLNGSSCAYKKDFGGSKYCDCPVRKELYRKYGV